MLMQRVIACNKDLETIDIQRKKEENKQAVIVQYLSPTHLTREMLEVLIDHIVVKNV